MRYSPPLRFCASSYTASGSGYRVDSLVDFGCLRGESEVPRLVVELTDPICE